MSINSFAISTNHPYNKYKPGQTVRGKVHFNLEGPKTVRGVYVRLKGIAKVSFWLRSGHGKNSTRTNYSAEHEYFNDRIYFAGEDGGDTFELPAGDYDHKFQYELPNRLPSSYDGDHGSIKYTIKAVLDIPLGFDDEEETNLDITSPIDLNLMPYLNRPDQQRAQTNLCCLCCQSGPIRLEVSVPKTGYIRGENIPIRIDVENSTSSTIEKIECKLVQTITFHAQIPQHQIKDVDTTLSDKHFRGVAARSTEEYDEILTVPPGDDLNFDNCRLLEVSYNIKIKAKVDGCHLNLAVSIPITLGNIPHILNNMPQQPVSILAGLGTPYPYQAGEGDASAGSSSLPEKKM